MRVISKRLVDLIGTVLSLGHAGENLYTQVRFDSKSVFDQYPDAIPSLIVDPPVGDSYPAVVFVDGDTVCWNVTNSDLLYDGEGAIQLTFMKDDVIVKSYIAKTSISKSIDPVGTIPTPIESWIETANEVIGEANQAASRAESAAEHQPYVAEDGYWYVWNGSEYEKTYKATGDQGPQGEQGPSGMDGYSPTVETTRIEGGYKIVFTDMQGSHELSIFDGTDGQDGQDGSDGKDGLSPSVTVTNITGGHRVTVVDAAGSHSFDVMNGVDGERGPQGPTGDPGRDGSDGAKGDKGDKGDTGAQGPQGIQGSKGDKGDAFTYEDFTPEQLEALIGPQGPQGEKGNKGDKGDTGNTGPKGDKGDTGDTGPKGDHGDPVDVQINGQSIIQNDIANILPAEANLYGVVKAATMEDILQIIEDYEQGDDEDVLFVANYVYDLENFGRYETEADAADIVDAFTQGKHVTVKLNFNESGGSSPGSYSIHGDMYLTMTGYQSGYEDYGTIRPDSFFFGPARESVYTTDPSWDIFSFVRNPHIATNGKLRFDIYAD